MFINLFNYEKEQNKNIVCTWSINYVMNKKTREKFGTAVSRVYTKLILYKMNDLQ